MKDKVLDRAQSWEGKKLSVPNGKANEVEFPRSNPGDAVRNRPAKSGPNVPTNK